jgi:hypothetical protein
MALAIGFTTLAAAQDEAAKQVYDVSAVVATNVKGVRTFNPPPAGYNPLTATEQENAVYGFPPRPPQEDAVSYSRWAKAMMAAKNRWNGNLKVHDYSSTPAKPAPAPAGASDATTVGPTVGYYYNWSGFINTNTLKKYSKTSSFYYVVSNFNVPTAQEAFNNYGFETGNICDGLEDIEVNWNGIDGFSNGNALLQGGTLSAVACSGGSTGTGYESWIEWYPAYPILGAFGVNPGDDFFVETWDTSATQGYVYLDDETTQTYASYSITSNGGPGLIGNSAEYIVERPCCEDGYFYPLANYVQDFWAPNDVAYTFYEYNKGLASVYYPGSTSLATFLAIMVNDADTANISVPEALGKYGIFFEDENCAYVGGCAL